MIQEKISLPATVPEKTPLTPARIETIVAGIIGIVLVVAISWGWWQRRGSPINPEHGLGYALGIIGGCMMLALLIYPMRKRIKSLANFGSVGFWFRFHMILGLGGPLAILFHARFSWGALNSAVALITMLVVAGSGLVGRFLYSRVHRGYSGRKLEVRGLLSEMHDSLDRLADLGPAGNKVRGFLVPFEQAAVAAGASFWTSATAVVVLGYKSRLAHFQVKRALGKLPPSQGISHARVLRLAGEMRLISQDYFRAVRRASAFAFYDRLLRMWHLLHLPLFVLLVASAVLHIVAVHMY